MMIRMKTVRVAIIVASAALPMLPNGTLEMYIEVKERNDDDHYNDEGR